MEMALPAPCRKPGGGLQGLRRIPEAKERQDLGAQGGTRLMNRKNVLELILLGISLGKQDGKPKVSHFLAHLRKFQNIEVKGRGRGLSSILLPHGAVLKPLTTREHSRGKSLVCQWVCQRRGLRPAGDHHIGG